jgi:putative NIF3 family GTP cyclohydrolase 1 type 2
MITAREIVQRVVDDWPANPNSADGFAFGEPRTPVTGVAVTFLATFDVLRRAANKGLNLVITHEPTLYTNGDDTTRIDPDPVAGAKRNFITQHGLVVWRLHDLIHAGSRDGIVDGFIDAMGWQQCRVGDSLELFKLDETTVGQLADELRRRLGAKGLRIVGDPAMPCSGVGLTVGSYPYWRQVGLLQRSDVDVLVAGETREWETVEYVRDAAAMGQAKAMIVAGHAATEEPGMRLLTHRIAELAGEVPVEFVPAGVPFA